MKSYKQIAAYGLAQALGVVLYIGFVAFVMTNFNKLFGIVPDVLGMVTFLLMFSTSALVCGVIVFYKPYKLFFEDKKSAVQLVLYTGAWLSVLFLLLLIGISLSSLV